MLKGPRISNKVGSSVVVFTSRFCDACWDWCILIVVLGDMGGVGGSVVLFCCLTDRCYMTPWFGSEDTFQSCLFDFLCAQVSFPCLKTCRCRSIFKSLNSQRCDAVSLFVFQCTGALHRVFPCLSFGVCWNGPKTLSWPQIKYQVNGK